MDNAAIVRHAECEANVVLWDGGNNDAPFFLSDFYIVLADAHGTGHDQNSGVSVSVPLLD